MAGPRFLPGGDIINPFTELQKTVSSAGDIFREYEEDRRATQIHNEKLKEHYRQDDERTYLRGYTPDLGKDGFGVTDAARTAIEKEFAPLYAEAAKEGRDTAELDAQKAQVYKGAVTREQLERDITGQLRPHVSADRIPGLLPLFSQGVTSLADIQATESATAAAVNEAQQNTVKNLIESVKAMNTGLGRGSSSSSSGGSAGTKTLFGGGISSADWNKQTEEGKEAIGWRDHKKAYNLVRDQITEVNENRAAANLPVIPPEDLDKILASTYRRGHWDNTSDVTDEQKARDVVRDYARNADVMMYTATAGRGGSGAPAYTRTQFSPADMQLIRGGQGARVARGIEELEALRVRALVDRYTGRTPATAAPVPRPSADGTVRSGAGTGGGTTTPGGSGTTTQPAGSGIVVEGGTTRQQQQQEVPSDATAGDEQATANERLANVIAAVESDVPSEVPTTPEAIPLADRPLAELENLREQTAQNMERARLAGDNAAVRESILEYQELGQAIARRESVDRIGEDWVDRPYSTAAKSFTGGLSRLREWDRNRIEEAQEARIQEYPEVLAEVRRLRALAAQPAPSRYEEKVLRNQLDKATRRLHSLRDVPRLLGQ